MARDLNINKLNYRKDDKTKMKIIPKTVVGIDLHDHLVQLVELRQSNGDTTLRAYNRVVIPEGVIKDGAIQNEEDFKTILKALIRNANPSKVDTKAVAIILPPRIIFTHIFAFPAALSKKDISRALPYEAEIVIPYPMKDLYWDFAILDRDDSNGDSKQYQYIMFAAVEKAVADKYTKTLDAIGIKPMLYGVHVEALKYALESQIPQEGKSLIIEVGALSTNYLTIKHGHIKHFISSNEGTSHLIDDISSEFKVSKDELFAKWENHKEDPKFSEKIREFVNSKYKMATDIILAKQETKKEKVQNIILTGEFSNLPGFYEIAKKQFGKRNIIIGDPKKGLLIEDDRFIQKGSASKAPYSIYFTNAIGVALDALKSKEGSNINLIPSWLKRQFLSKKIEVAIIAGSLAMAIISLSIAGFVFYKHLTSSFERESLEVKKSNIELTLYGTRYQDVKEDLEAFNTEVITLSNIDNGLFSLPQTITMIYELMPEGITINSFKYKDSDMSVSISGIADERSSLLEMQDNLDNSEFIDAAEMPLSSFDTKSSIPFQVNITLIFSSLPEYASN
ncbi:hypothetical protein AUK45_03740 [Candidatus Peregrinibacteria bacterium CG2_30_44_17]|nr:MAG: hypothetical protein AUK45_03740 [Candidatus Peregrinibacteria bacterium CG2_30_44_17]